MYRKVNMVMCVSRIQLFRLIISSVHGDAREHKLNELDVNAGLGVSGVANCGDHVLTLLSALWDQ